MRKNLVDATVSLISVMLGVGVLFAIPHQVPGATLADVSSMSSPAFFPILGGAFLVLCGVVLGVNTMVVQAPLAASGENAPDAAKPFRLAAVAALLVVYLFAIRAIGMVISSMVLIAVMAPLLNYTRWRVIAVAAPLFPLAVYVLFEKMLRILLPHGWGF